jgi:hypothetical protein
MLHSSRFEFERNTIDAVAQMRRWRAIIKYVAKMAAAAAAMHLVANHAVTAIGIAFDCPGQWIVEARPARPALEFHFRDEQRLMARGASKGAGSLFMQQSAASWNFSAMCAHNLILFGRKQPAPFGFSVRDRILLRHDKRSRVFNYLIASGLTGEPTAPVIGIAGATNRNS